MAGAANMHFFHERRYLSQYNNKEFHFYLNGQTGKIVADRPISAGKAVTYGIGIFVLTLIITMIGGLLFI